MPADGSTPAAGRAPASSAPSAAGGRPLVTAAAAADGADAVGFHPRAVRSRLVVGARRERRRGGSSRMSSFAAGWSSLVARRAHNPKVGGSNPPPATIERRPARFVHRARRLTSVFAFEATAEHTVYRGFFWDLLTSAYAAPCMATARTGPRAVTSQSSRRMALSLHVAALGMPKAVALLKCFVGRCANFDRGALQKATCSSP